MLNFSRNDQPTKTDQKAHITFFSRLQKNSDRHLTKDPNASGEGNNNKETCLLLFFKILQTFGKNILRTKETRVKPYERYAP